MYRSIDTSGLARLHWMPNDNLAPIHAETVKRIENFADFPAGWHYGEGHAPTEKIINMSIDILIYLTSLGFHRVEGFPGLNGEIMVTAYSGNHCVEIIIERDESISMTHEVDNVEKSTLNNLPWKNAWLEIRNMASEIWNFSVSSTPRILTKRDDTGSRILRTNKSDYISVLAYSYFRSIDSKHPL